MEARLFQDTLIQSYRVVGADCVCYEAFEQTEELLSGKAHATLLHWGEALWGRIGTRPLPPTINSLPAMSDIRVGVVREYLESEYRRAYMAIIGAFPEAARGKKNVGRITCQNEAEY